MMGLAHKFLQDNIHVVKKSTNSLKKAFAASSAIIMSNIFSN